MRLTRRGAAVLVGAAGCWAIGELAGFFLFRALAGVAVGAVLVAVSVTLFRPKVAISRTVHPDRVERGAPALASLVVRNTSGRRQGGFAAGDRIGARVHEIQVRPLAPGAEAVYHYELPTEARGRLRVGPHVLHRLDPFDLVRSDLTAGDTTSVWVYPRRHPMRPARAAHPRHHHDGLVTDPPLRGSTDLRAVRQYVIGDEVRHLHWKASARTGQLMVREYADPAQPRLTLVLDTRRSAMTPAVFEEAVEVAASLLYASAASGQHCRLVTSSGVDTPVDSGLRVARALLDGLCLVAQDAPADAPLAPPALAAARPSGALVVVTGADVAAAQQLRPDTVFRLGTDLAASRQVSVVASAPVLTSPVVGGAAAVGAGTLGGAVAVGRADTPAAGSGGVISALDAARAAARWNARVGAA